MGRTLFVEPYEMVKKRQSLWKFETINGQEKGIDETGSVTVSTWKSTCNI